MKNVRLIVAIGIGLFIACTHQVSGPTTGTGGDTGGNNNNGGNGGGDNQGDSVICFESEILPIFLSNCAKSGCHDAASHEEGYVFDSYNGIMKGIKPGDPNDSEIFERSRKQKKMTACHRRPTLH